MSVFSYSRKLSWGLYFLLALLQSSQGISGYGTLMWCRRMVSSHHSVVFQTAACDRLCYPGKKTRRGYYQEPTLEFIKALISNYCWHVSAWLAGWDSNPHITGQSRASYSFLTTLCHHSRNYYRVVVWTMSLPCFYKFRYALYSLYTFTRLFPRLSTKLSWTIIILPFQEFLRLGAIHLQVSNVRVQKIETAFLPLEYPPISQPCNNIISKFFIIVNLERSE